MAKASYSHKRSSKGLSRKRRRVSEVAQAEIPKELLDEIENQRSVLVTIITLLHCLHVVLEDREENVERDLSFRAAAGLEWASLPEMTAMLLERTHGVLSALDSLNLTKALRPCKP